MKSLLQSKIWAKIKQKVGWQCFEIDGVQILKKDLLAGKSFLYIPEVGWQKIQPIKKFREKLDRLAKKENAIFARLEILVEESEDKINQIKKQGFQKAFEEIQPEDRQWIDLSQAEDEILAAMKPKGRYNIRLAIRKGVKVFQKTDKKAIDILYGLYAQTAKREDFAPRSKEYFYTLASELFPTHSAAVFVALYQGRPLAAILVTFYEKIASYLYGGSSSEHRELMAPYLAHWEAIRQAKKRGCKIYDLLAIAPEDQPAHKFAGLTRFKQQFGGKAIKLLGSWDRVYSRSLYLTFKALEKFRRR